MFEIRAEAIVGSRIRVVNTDSSTHVEQIEEWNPGERIRLRMTEFTPPLSRLAVAIEELWEFQRTGPGCTVTRTLRMFPVAWWTSGVLWLISFLLKGAIQRHMLDIRRQVER